MAYGARLESVLGATPREFESRILRRTRRRAPAAMARARRVVQVRYAGRVPVSSGLRVATVGPRRREAREGRSATTSAVLLPVNGRAAPGAAVSPCGRGARDRCNHHWPGSRRAAGDRASCPVAGVAADRSDRPEPGPSEPRSPRQTTSGVAVSDVAAGRHDRYDPFGQSLGRRGSVGACSRGPFCRHPGSSRRGAISRRSRGR